MRRRTSGLRPVSSLGVPVKRVSISRERAIRNRDQTERAEVHGIGNGEMPELIAEGPLRGFGFVSKPSAGMASSTASVYSFVSRQTGADCPKAAGAPASPVSSCRRSMRHYDIRFLPGNTRPDEQAVSHSEHDTPVGGLVGALNGPSVPVLR